MSHEALASVLVFHQPWAKVLLMVHLLLAVFALGVVTHHWWALVRGPAHSVRLARHARWMAISYPLSWLFGMVIYPTYIKFVRKGADGLDKKHPWATGVFEIKEHLGTFALVMLVWLVLSAYRHERLSGLERVSYRAGTWVFTVIVYFVFISGAVVTAVKGI